MDAAFRRRDDGVIDIDLGSQWRPLTETLLDAVTTRAPRGSDGINPSTFWIDRTLAALRQGPLDGAVIANGNATELVLKGGAVVARAQYETFTDQPVPVTDLVEVLERWRAEVAKDRAVGS